MILRFLTLLTFVVSLSACIEPPYANIDNEDISPLMDQGIPIFDIRRPDEWKQTGVIEGSQLLTFVDAGGRVKADFLPKFTQQIGKDDPVILICRTGNRTSALATHLMEKMGYTKVYNVQNGINSWINQRLPISRL